MSGKEWLDKNYPSYTEGAMSREAVAHLLDEYIKEHKPTLEFCMALAENVHAEHPVCNRLCLATSVAIAIWDILDD